MSVKTEGVQQKYMLLHAGYSIFQSKITFKILNLDQKIEMNNAV